jgi:hypothetical protein
LPGYQHFHLPPPYRVLASLGARALAWEWVRRNADFRSLWAGAPSAVRRADADAALLASLARSRRPRIDIALHSQAKRWAPWGLTFRGVARHAGSARAAGRLGARRGPSPAYDRAAGTMGARDR